MEGVRSGHSRVLVLRGEAGVGKTALLGYVASAAKGFRIARAVGVQSEMELPFAGLHALCAPILDRLRRLPGPQRDALSTAFGLSAGPPPDRFLVGLAVLSLLADAAEEQPLVCIVDDAQWLDQVSAQTLAFVGRRLLAERVGLVFGLRETGNEHALDGLPELRIEGLGADDARRLLDATIPGPLDERVRDRILGEAGGNPLALLELPHGLNPVAVAGGFGLPGGEPLTSRLEQGFVRRLEPLPAETRQLVLVAAAEPVGDVALLWRAAELLGIGRDAAGPAQAAGLVEIGTRVRFRHPLVRSAAYRAAHAPERRDVHRALADATDAQVDPDRRAWHLAHAAAGFDEEVAGELERSAGRAQARGGIAAAAAFLERAAELTPDPRRQGARALSAAQAMLDAGAAEAAEGMLTMAELTPLDEHRRARSERLRAEIAFARRRGTEAPALLLNAARRLEPVDAAMARETHLETLSAAIFAGRLGGQPGIRDAAEAARAAPPAAQPPREIDLLLDGLATRFTEGYPAGVAPLRDALAAFRSADDVRWLWLACRLAQDLWDDELWYELATRALRVARETGALRVLPIAATFRAALHICMGQFGAAASLIEEAAAISQATGIAPLKYGTLMLAAWRGDDAVGFELIEAGKRAATQAGDGAGLGAIEWAAALLYNSRGRYAEALAAAERACEHDDVVVFAWALVELIEAGVRSGAKDATSGALDRLSERTQACGTDWALGMEAYSRALLTDTRAGRAALPRGRRATRAQPCRGSPRPRAARVRRMAASRAPARRRT